MNLEGKNVLLISPEPWSHIFVSKHHYAIHLGQRNNRVFFLNPPGDSLSVNPTNYLNVCSVSYRGFPRGLRFYPRAIQRWFIWRAFARLQQLCGVTFDVVWSFDNSVFFDFSMLPTDMLKICHIVDLNQDFQTKRAARTADYCFCTTELIKNRLLSFNARVFKINHGFNSRIVNSAVPVPGKANIRALYSGNLSMPYIDWRVLNEIVTHNPHIDFLFVGPNGNDFDLKVNPHHEYKKQLFAHGNAIAVGKVDAGLLQSYLSKADILLVSYQEKYFDDQANPHKIMEYLGAGKVIVSTWTKEFENYQDLIEMAPSNAEFPATFMYVVKHLCTFNNAERIQRRQLFAQNNSYDKQIERIEQILNSRGKPIQTL